MQAYTSVCIALHVRTRRLIRTVVCFALPQALCDTLPADIPGDHCSQQAEQGLDFLSFTPLLPFTRGEQFPGERCSPPDNGEVTEGAERKCIAVMKEINQAAGETNDNSIKAYYL